MRQEPFSLTVNHGYNIKRIREILSVKQVTLAVELMISQQAVSELENRAEIGDEILNRIAKVLKVPVEAIKNFNDKEVRNIITNTFDESAAIPDNSSQLIIDKIDKLSETMEHLLKAVEENIL